MDSAGTSPMARWRLLFTVALAFLYVSVAIQVSNTFLYFQKNSTRPFPFGIYTTPNGALFVQDFAYNMEFLRGIHARLVPRPYRMKDQEQMVRQMIPGAESGLPHAYSPVSFVLTLALPYVTGFQAYLVYCIGVIGGMLLLVYFYLLPKASSPLQIGLLAVSLPSICTLTALAIGQTGMLTTMLLAVFWLLLQHRLRSHQSLIALDFALAGLFWAICFKTSVAWVPFTLLLGSQSWRALGLGSGLLGATWNLVATYYGGWWTGLQDYSYLLNHYNNGELIPFIQFGNHTGFEKTYSALFFFLNRSALLVSSAGLLLLGWTRRIILSELFQLIVWVFLLFSPYLLPSEDWILCLLFVEGTFFKSDRLLPALGKLMLVAAIFNVRSNVGLPEVVVNYPCKLALFLWLLIHLFQNKQLLPTTSLSRHSLKPPHAA